MRSLGLLLAVAVGCGGSSQQASQGAPQGPAAPATPAIQRTLTVAVSGGGTVVSNPMGISCPGTCSASFEQGTNVALTATGGVTWSGSCGGTGACRVAMGADESVSATFAADECAGIVPDSLGAPITATVDATSTGGNCTSATADGQGNVAGLFAAGDGNQWTTWPGTIVDFPVHLTAETISPQELGFQGAFVNPFASLPVAVFTTKAAVSVPNAQEVTAGTQDQSPGTQSSYRTYPAATSGSILLGSSCVTSSGKGTLLVSRFDGNASLIGNKDLGTGGCAASAAVSDALERTLVAVLEGGRIQARWLDRYGAFLTGWFDVGPAPDSWAPALEPLIGGGAVLRSGEAWIASFRSGVAAVDAVPAFLKSGAGLKIVRGGKAYALLPGRGAADFGSVELVSPGGKQCGAVQVQPGAQLQIGRDGTVISMSGANSCTLNWWSGILHADAPPAATPPPPPVKAPAPFPPQTSCLTPAAADPEWQWESPTPQGQTLTAALTFSSNDIWAAGVRGAIVHWDGKAWTPARVPTNDSLRSIWGTSPSDVWVGGDNGDLFHCDGKGWTPSPSGTTLPIRQIWGTSPSDIWAMATTDLYSSGSADSSVLHWNGMGWSQVALPVQAQQPEQKVLWGVSKKDVWVGGCGELDGLFRTILYHWDGATWTQSLPENEGCISGLAGTSATDIWATAFNRYRCDDDGEGSFSVCTSYAAMHWDGNGWSTEDGPNPGFEVLLSAGIAGEVWAESPQAQGFDLYRQAAGAWTKVTTLDPDTHPLANGFSARVISGASAADAWFLGQTGKIEHWNGQILSQLNQALPDIVAMWGVSDDDLWALGHASVSHRTAAGWTTTDLSGFLPELESGLESIWGTSSDDVWITGWGLALHWDGTAWKSSAVPFQFGQSTLWGSGPSDYYCGGEEGLFHYDGSSWTHLFGGIAWPEDGDEIAGVWGSSASDVWAITTAFGQEDFGSKIFHFDGKSWTISGQFAQGRFWSLSGTGPNDVWAGGEALALHWDGIAWQRISAGLGDWDMFTLLPVWARAPDDVWTLGLNIGISNAMHFDGLRWSQVQLPAGGSYYSMPGGSLWSFGAGTLVRHK
jgi:hypothetical protein